MLLQSLLFIGDEFLLLHGFLQDFLQVLNLKSPPFCAEFIFEFPDLIFEFFPRDNVAIIYCFAGNCSVLLEAEYSELDARLILSFS